MATNDFAMALTDSALIMFCKIAIEVMQNDGVKGLPTSDNLFKGIRKEVYSDEIQPTLKKDGVSREDLSPQQVEVSPPPAPVPAPAPAVTQVKSAAKLTSKDLKKNPFKITKNQLDKDGKEVEVEVEVEFPYVAGFDYSNTC